MGKGGRFMCIVTPYALTIASLICIIMVGLGCTDKSNSTLNDLFFFRANVKNFTTSSKTTSTASNLLEQAGVDASNQQLTEVLQKAKEMTDLKDFYAIGLWGYCEGNIKDGNFHTTFCSNPEPMFWFNPFKVADIPNAEVKNMLPKDAQKTMDIYKKVSKWMFIAYVVAFVATAVELLVGIFAICSRWGSCVTTLISSVSLLFTIAASATATALYATINAAFKSSLKAYGVTGTMGQNMFAATWLAVAFSLAASLFWLISSCCCSGRSPYNHRHRNERPVAEKAPYTYEPLGPDSHTPYGAYDTSYPAPPMQTHGNNMPMQNMNTNTHAYEPFRHV